MGSHFSLKTGINYKNSVVWLIIFKVTAEADITSASTKRSCRQNGKKKKSRMDNRATETAEQYSRFNVSIALDFLTYFSVFDKKICPSL